MNALACESRIVKMDGGEVIEIELRGVHEWTHGTELTRYAESKIAEHDAAAVLFNLLEYEYVFGNDVTAFFSVAFRPPVARRTRPICIVAKGITRQSLCNFMKSGHLIEALSIEFADSVELGLAWLRGRLSETA